MTLNYQYAQEIAANALQSDTPEDSYDAFLMDKLVLTVFDMNFHLFLKIDGEYHYGKHTGSGKLSFEEVCRYELITGKTMPENNYKGMCWFSAEDKDKVFIAVNTDNLDLRTVCHTLIHEVGHGLLHNPQADDISYFIRNYYQDTIRVELEAELFTYFFLKKLNIRAASYTHTYLELCCEKFRTSLKTELTRIENKFDIFKIQKAVNLFYNKYKEVIRD